MVDEKTKMNKTDCLYFRECEAFWEDVMRKSNLFCELCEKYYPIIVGEER